MVDFPERHEEGDYLGEFEVTGDKLRVTDPCYKKETWCAGVLEKVKSGVWEGFVLGEDCGRGILGGHRVGRIYVRHSTASLTSRTAPRWKWHEENIDVGVDSGQCGFFDEDRYPEGECGEYGDTSTFYGRACEQTLSESKDHPGGGIVTDDKNSPMGAVSSSGYGDGSYRCYTLRNDDGELIAAQVDFLFEEPGTCSKCGEEFRAEDLEPDGYCYDCSLVDCKGCGEQFTDDDVNREGFCSACEEKTCVVCGEFSEDDLNEDGFCKECASDEQK